MFHAMLHDKRCLLQKKNGAPFAGRAVFFFLYDFGPTCMQADPAALLLFLRR
jgi:hypothetical protein